MRMMLIACAYLLSASVVIAETPLSGAKEECVPVAVMDGLIREISTHQNFRLVQADKFSLALRIYRRGTQDGRPWTEIYLIDAVDPSNGGIMAVGVEELICQWVMVPASQWVVIVKLLEGEPS